MVLLGLTKSGKSPLINKLREPTTSPGGPKDEPIVGANNASIPLTRRKSLPLVEVGGAVSPTWSSYITSTSALHLAFDCCIVHSLPPARQALRCLTQCASVSLHHIIILLNKRDVPLFVPGDEAKHALDLHRIRLLCNAQLHTA